MTENASLATHLRVVYEGVACLGVGGQFASGDHLQALDDGLHASSKLKPYKHVTTNTYRLLNVQQP
jgi:hypothetical protein